MSIVMNIISASFLFCDIFYFRIWNGSIFKTLLLAGCVATFVNYTLHFANENSVLNFKLPIFTESQFILSESPLKQLPKNFTNELHDVKKRVLTILLWTNAGTHYPRTISKNVCGPCHITKNRSLIEKSEAVVIHCKSKEKLPDLNLRKPNQVYVWWCRESPPITRAIHRVNLMDIPDNYFNATMTHRRDSEFFYPYADVLHRKLYSKRSRFVKFYGKVKDILPRKRYLAVGLVSNCLQERKKHIKKLFQAGLDVHLHGRCYFNSFPPFRTKLATIRLSKYKFFLAFENTYHCRDYISEKFWENALYTGLVPIVRGATEEDLKQIAPPHSYINVDDYDNIKELVEYINYLDKHDDAYMEYFRWRKVLEESEDSEKVFSNISKLLPYQMFLKTTPIGFCDVCKKLNENSFETPKSIPSLETWWYGTEYADCWDQNQMSSEKN